MMSGRIFEWPLVIKEQHLDTFGHVNNATYLQIMEQARWDLITERGFGFKEMKAKGVGPVILEIQIRFKQELRNREKCVIQTICTSYQGKIGKLEQTIITENAEVACSATFTVGLFDLKARKLIDPTPEWLDVIGFTKNT
jgi:thioesterase-3